MSELTIRGDGGDFVKVSVLGKSIPSATDFWDGNWVNVEVELVAGRFEGRYSASFRTTDFAGLEAALREAYHSLESSFDFEPMEQQLAIHVKGDGRGHFAASCRAQDEAGVGNVLEFELYFDQTVVPEFLKSLTSINAAYPVLDPDQSRTVG